MADKTSLIITSSDTSGKTSNKTITDINPATSVASVRAFAQNLNNLTTNTYEGAAIVTRTEIPTDATDPCFVVKPTVIPHDSINEPDEKVFGFFSYAGWGRTPTISGQKLSYIDITVNQNGFMIENVGQHAQISDIDDCTFTITLPASPPYKAVSVDVTITGCDASNIIDIE